jgi:hypothetical protein
MGIMLGITKPKLAFRRSFPLLPAYYFVNRGFQAKIIDLSWK